MPDISKSNLSDMVSSDDLIKQAWGSMGRAETGERTTDTRSLSAEMAKAASLAGAASQMRSEGLAEIEESLKQAIDRRLRVAPADSSAPARSPERKPGSRSQPPPARSGSAPTRPAPPRRPPPTLPSGDEGRSGPSIRGLGWLVFALISLLGGAVGWFTDDSSSTPDIDTDPGVTVTVDFSDLTTTTVVIDTGSENVVFANIRDIGPGTCIEALPLGALVDDVPTIPCAEPHKYELFANTELAMDGDYPGEDVFDIAFDACDAMFFDYVGESYGSSEWYVDVITPTEQGWNEFDDRAVNCLLYLWDNDSSEVVYVTGSAEGTGDAAG